VTGRTTFITPPPRCREFASTTPGRGHDGCGTVRKAEAQNLKEPAQLAARAVKDTATDSGGTVKKEGTSAAQDVQGQAQDAKQTVQDQQG